MRELIGPIQGYVTVRFNGVVVERTHNMIVFNGFQYVRDRILGATPAVMSHMAFGSDDDEVAPTIATTKLRDEVARVALSTAAQSLESFYGVRYVATLTGADVPSLPVTIREAGVVNHASDEPDYASGIVMINRAQITAIDMTNVSSAIQVEFDICLRGGGGNPA